MEPLEPVASICATPADNGTDYRQTDSEQTDRWMDGWTEDGQTDARC